MRSEVSTGEDPAEAESGKQRGMTEWMLAWRDRLLGNPRFQAQALEP